MAETPDRTINAGENDSPQCTGYLWEISQKGRNAMELIPGNDNVFKDIGFDRAEAANLSVRPDLMLDLRKYIESKGWTQREAAAFSASVSRYETRALRHLRSRVVADCDAWYDLDEDGTIGFGDFLLFANAFGTHNSST